MGRPVSVQPAQLLRVLQLEGLLGFVFYSTHLEILDYFYHSALGLENHVASPKKLLEKWGNTNVHSLA